MKTLTNIYLLLAILMLAGINFSIKPMPSWGDIEDSVNAGVNFAGKVPDMISDFKKFNEKSSDLIKFTNNLKDCVKNKFASPCTLNKETYKKELVVKYLTTLSEFLKLINNHVIGTFPNYQQNKRNTEPNSLLILPLTEAEIFGLGWSDVEDVMKNAEKVGNILEKVSDILEVVAKNVQ